MTQEQIASLEKPRTDLNLYEALVNSIMGLDIVRQSKIPLDISVQQGVVTLRGVVMSRIMRRAVLFRATTTPGVQKVVDLLYEDPQLAVAVAVELAAEPELRAGPSTVKARSYQGIITLSGQVRSETGREAAKRAALRVEGVRQLVDHLSAYET